MILQCFAVYDRKAGAYITPWFAPNHGMALRSFATVLRDETHAFRLFPEDYSLFYLGDFDDSNGMFDGGEPVCIARAHELAATVEMEKPSQINLEEVLSDEE